MIKNTFLLAGAAAMVLAPSAALAEGRSTQIDVHLQVPYACEVSAGNYELDLTERAVGRNNVRAGVANDLGICHKRSDHHLHLLLGVQGVHHSGVFEAMKTLRDSDHDRDEDGLVNDAGGVYRFVKTHA